MAPRTADQAFDLATKEAALFYGMQEMEPVSIEVFLEIRCPELAPEDLKIIVSALQD